MMWTFWRALSTAPTGQKVIIESRLCPDQNPLPVSVLWFQNVLSKYCFLWTAFLEKASRQVKIRKPTEHRGLFGSSLLAELASLSPIGQVWVQFKIKDYKKGKQGPTSTIRSLFFFQDWENDVFLSKLWQFCTFSLISNSLRYMLTMSFFKKNTQVVTHSKQKKILL